MIYLFGDYVEVCNNSHQYFVFDVVGDTENWINVGRLQVSTNQNLNFFARCQSYVRKLTSDWAMFSASYLLVLHNTSEQFCFLLFW